MKMTLVLVLAVAASGVARAAERIVPPAVPGDIVVDEAFMPFLRGHAIGTQNYICAPAPTQSGRDWVFIGPQATVFNGAMQQILTHFPSKNPDRQDAIQATWQHSRDSSAVWGNRVRGSSDSNYVQPGAIEWLLLEVTGDEFGPTGGDTLAGAKYIQRVNTVGGVKPPEAECIRLNDRKLVDYEADYYFYK